MKKYLLVVVLLFFATTLYGEIQLLPFEGVSIEKRETHYKDKEGKEPVITSSITYGQHEIDMEREKLLKQIEALQNRDIQAEIDALQAEIDTLDTIQIELDKLK